MSLWHNTRRVDPNPTGKFMRSARAGIEKAGASSHRGMNFRIVQHKTGTTVRRTVFNVAIDGPYGNRAAYLTNFSSASNATAGARAWIDETEEGQPST